MRPLDNIVVVDLTRLLPGASATQILGDFGAEIIKVEEPPFGDPGRRLPPHGADESELFSLTNGGKKSIAINLKDPRGKSALLRLVAGADILVESFRPGVMDRLGLGYNELSLRNPKLIYAAITGYGQSGPNASLPGHDINYLSMVGLLDLMRGRDGSPAIPPVQLADLVGGALQAVVGILLALVSRSVTGRGQLVDVAMLDGLSPLLAVPIVMRMAGEHQQSGAGLLTGTFACYNVYKTGDDKWISVGALESKFWRTICEALGCEEFIRDQFADETRQSEMVASLSQRFRQKHARDWFALLKHACVTPVEKLSQAKPEIVPVLSLTPGQRNPSAPAIGENTREILISAGFDLTEIEQLERDGIVVTSKHGK